ncbi:MAG: hypothetical protein ACM32F_05040 [Betaproteobacteria bacterium]
MKVMQRLRNKPVAEPLLPHERDQMPDVPARPRRQGRRAYADLVLGRVDTDTRGDQLQRLARRLKSRPR